jgi:hypothetical protein
MKLQQQDLLYLYFDIPSKASLYLQRPASVALSSNSAGYIAYIKKNEE